MLERSGGGVGCGVRVREDEDGVGELQGDRGIGCIGCVVGDVALVWGE